MIKQVPSFKDSAGRLHESRLQALVSEKHIELRGIIQSGPGGIPIKNGSLQIGEAVQILSENAEKVVDIVRRYNKMIKNERIKWNDIPVTQ